MPALTTGQILKTVSGRDTAPVPRIARGSNRKIANSYARIFAWMIEEAKQEVPRQPNIGDHVLLMLGGMDPKAMTQSDIDMVNLIVFGE